MTIASVELAAVGFSKHERQKARLVAKQASNQTRKQVGKLSTKQAGQAGSQATNQPSSQGSQASSQPACWRPPRPLTWPKQRALQLYPLPGSRPTLQTNGPGAEGQGPCQENRGDTGQEKAKQDKTRQDKI